PGDADRRFRVLEIVRALLARDRRGLGAVEPSRGVIRQPLRVLVVSKEELRLRRDRPRHVDIRMPIEQLVQPRRPRSGRAADDELRKPQRPSVRSMMYRGRARASSSARQRYSPSTPIITSWT